MVLPPIRDGWLRIDPPSPGAWNMAVDELLLESASPGAASLRFYSWTPATLSLGYFQSIEHRREHAASRECPVVRRASGGGAIVHDDQSHELTYSLAFPTAIRDGRVQQDLYTVMHQSLVNALSNWGVCARLYAANANRSPTKDEAFLCFQRRAPGDVFLGEHKVAGSAQRRSATALLQHGSVLLNRSTAAPELPGISQLSGKVLAADELRQAWLASLHELWPVGWQADHGSDDQARRIAQQIATKFAHSRWTERR